MRYFLTTITICISLYATAQERTISQISKAYKEITAITDSCEKDPEYKMYAPYYCNQLVVNNGGKPWRAVGTYEKNIQFWYDDDPGHHSESDRGKNGIGVLKKITTVVHSTYTENEEYLFNDKGQLIFFYYKYSYNNGDPEMQEYRFYFSGNQLIKFISATPPATKNRSYQKESWNKILKDARQYQTIFLYTF